MQTITWIDRISDESNLWFQASKREDEHDYLGATALYLKDGIVSLSQNSIVRAALSSRCAAQCLASMGVLGYAAPLYAEAAELYCENANTAVSSSIRESLWSLREAYECFVLADDKKKAQEVYNGFAYLARKIDPFVEEGKIIQMAETRRGPHPVKDANRVQLDLPEEVLELMEKFIRLRRSSSERVQSRPRENKPRSTPGKPNDEKSIISKLG